MTTPQFRVFYAWQSDLPRTSGQDLIRQALSRAAADVERGLNGAIKVYVDEATRDETGSPNIPQTIFRKIATADAIVADVSLVVSSKGTRPSPNPNVLIEIGYAAARLGWPRVLLLGNSAWGNFPQDLPFDIDRHAAKSFRLTEEESKDTSKLKSSASNLAGILRDSIMAIVQASPQRPVLAPGDPEAAKRDRDIESLRTILHLVNPDCLTHLLRQAPKKMPSQLVSAWENFHAYWTAPSTHVYNATINAIVDGIHQDWDIALSFTDHYDPGNGRHEPVWSSMESTSSEDFRKASNALEDLEQKLRRLTQLVRNEFVEIDVNEVLRISAIAWAKDHDELHAVEWSSSSTRASDGEAPRGRLARAIRALRTARSRALERLGL